MSQHLNSDSLVPLTREVCEARSRALVVLLDEHISKFSGFVAPKHYRQHEEEMKSLCPGIWTGDGDQRLYVEELATWTAEFGKETPLERYSRRAKLAPDPESAAVLAGARDSVLSFWKVEGLHPTAGWILRDMLFDGTAWVVDDMLEQNFEPNTVECFLMRLLRVDSNGFWIVCGNIFALSEDPFDASEFNRSSGLKFIASGSSKHVELTRISAFAALFYARVGIYLAS